MSIFVSGMHKLRLFTMIRINGETPIEILQSIKIGDMVTDGFSKTSLVESIEISDDGLYKIYEFHLITGRVIVTKRRVEYVGRE